MIKPELITRFLEESRDFEKSIHALEAGEIDRKTFKGISGGFGCYAQREGGYMLRLRFPAGQITKETLKFIGEKVQQYEIDLLKITTCQTIQAHNLNAHQVVSLMRDCLEAGIITRGGGGDFPRNVMAPPLTGTSKEETFDVLPYALTVSDYLLNRMMEFQLPRKLKVGFSNTEENETHATFRDLGFVAKKDYFFSVYCAGGLGPNPKMGICVVEHAMPQEITLYVSAMLRLFLAHGNYKVRAKARTRYLQDTLGADGIKKEFLRFLEKARQEEAPLPICNVPLVPQKTGAKSSCQNPAVKALLGKRVFPQKQPGLYTLSWHGIGGCLSGQEFLTLYNVVKEIPKTELRLSPDGTIYLLHLTQNEVLQALKSLPSDAETLFETSTSCIGVPICQHGLRCAQGLLRACIERIRQEGLPDQVLPRIHISGCPSSCGSHQSAVIGFVGHTKKIHGETYPAFRVWINGSAKEPGTQLGTELSVILEALIPEFLTDVGKRVAREHTTFAQWYPNHKEDLEMLIQEYSEKEAL